MAACLLLSASTEAAEPPRILLPERTVGGWRITWVTRPRANDELQRWDGSSLTQAGKPLWESVVRILATDTLSSAEESFAATSRRFYRVARISAGSEPDTQPPVVAAFQAEILGLSESSKVRLSAVASDASGLRGMQFFVDDFPLGDAINVDGRWVLEVPFASVAEASRLSVHATDSVGNTTAVHRLPPKRDDAARRFFALDQNGRPGDLVSMSPGAVPPLLFLPAGAVSDRDSLAIRLSQGAQYVIDNGREVLRFNAVDLQLGRDTAFQFDAGSLTRSAAARHASTSASPEAGTRTIIGVAGGVRITSAAPLELPAGPVTAADLEALLGLDPGEGVPLRVFERFTLRWHSGTLDDTGIRGGRFSFDDLPLPALSGDYPDHVLPLAAADEVRIPYHGTYAWPSGDAAAPELRVGPADPGWLTLRPNGTMGWHNRSEIRFPGGGRLRVDVGLDDPLYRLAVFADSIQVPLIGNLADLILPDDPGACLSPGLDPAMLTRATGCLEALGRAYFNVAGSAVAASPIPENPEAPGPAQPPEDLDTSISVVNAWGHRAVAAIGPALPLAPQRELITHTGRSAAASTDLAAAAHHRAALARAAAALHRGGLSGSPEDLAALNAALEEATASALLRARDPSGIASYSALLKTLEALVETQSLLAEANRPQNHDLHQAVADRVRDFLDARFAELAIVPGQFSVSTDSPIQGMNRFALFQHLHELLDTIAQAALLGVDDDLTIPFAEALTQIAQRLWTLVDLALAEAEAAQDLHGFQYTFEDLLDLQASRQLSIFPNRPELAALPMPGSTAFATIVGRLDALFVSDLARPYPERTLNNELVRLRRLARILREVPPEVTFAAPPFERAHERVNEKLADAVDQADSNNSVAELLALIEIGILNEQLRRRMNLPATANWEGHQLPILVARAAEVARTQRAWSEMNHLRRVLLDEARRFGTLADVSRRRLYLEGALPVLEAARDVAVQLWVAERDRRNLSPLGVADLLLPGDIRIDKAAGAAMGDRHAGWLVGAFRGRVALPKFDGHFEVSNASFDHRGTFDLAAHGSASFQGVTLGIAQRHPLTVSYRFPGPVRLRGEGQLALPNGMNFAARITLDDPLYGFRFEARDLRFALLQELTLLRPTLNLSELAAAGDTLRGAYLDYFGSMNAAFEGLARKAGDLPAVDASALGEPPDFESPQLTLPLSELNAWSRSAFLAVAQNINRSHNLTTASLREVFQTIRDDATLAANTLETESRFLEVQRERLALQRMHSQAFDAALDAGLIAGNPDIAALTDMIRQTTRAEARLYQRHLASRPPADLVETSRHITVLLDLAALGQQLDAAFADIDDDGLPDATDNCPALWSSQPLPDTDNDGFGDGCDPAPTNAALPEPGPCADALRVPADPMAQGRALFACQIPRELTRLGLHPATGVIANTNLFQSLPAEEVEYRMFLMLELEAHAEVLGVDSNLATAVTSARLHLRDRLISLWSDELERTPDSNPLQQFELVIALTDLRSLHQDPVDGELDDQIKRHAPAVARLTDDELVRLERAFDRRRDDRERLRSERIDRDFARHLDTDLEHLANSRRRGIVGDSLVLIETLLGGLSPESAPHRQRVDAFVRHQVQQLRENLVDPQFLADRIADAETLASGLAEATAWAVRMMPDGDPLVSELVPAWNDLTTQLTAVAEARRAWWMLHRYGLVLHRTLQDHGAAMPAVLRTAHQQSFAATVLAADRVFGALATLAEAVDSEEFKVRLPGELRVRRAFGGIVFDRETEVWTGSFGGRLEFPDFQKAFFEISQATIATDGSYQLAASTGGPLGFGRLGLTSSLQVTGTLDGLQSFEGTGQLAVPLDTVTNHFAVALGYDFGQRRLRFDTQANDIDWRITDDFVLLNGGFGFEFSTAEPDGALTFRGSAGLFARDGPLPATLHRTNFHLLVTNAAVRLAANTNSTTIALTNGTFLLPEFFQTSLCSTNRIFTNFIASPQGQTSQLHALALALPPVVAGNVGPAISLSPTNPISVEIQYQPASVTFGGALQFRDLGFQIPGFEALELAVCQARLIFPPHQLPYLTNLHAAFQVPLPNQTNIIEVADAAFELGGLPIGTVRLRTHLDLYRDGDWRLTLLGRESPLCPAGTGLTLKPDPAFNHRLTLRFDAGMEFAIPASVLSDHAGGALAAAACGSVSIPADQPPWLGLDALGLAIGSARLGGSQGVTLTNASLQLTGLTNLFAPSPERPFRAILGGRILVDNAGFGLSNAVFHFEGAALPRFTVTELTVVQPGTILGLAADLPLNVDEGRVRFLRDALPIPALFAATNLAVTVSGSVALPPGPKPVLGSRVRDLGITFLPDGKPFFSVDGIGFTVDLTALVGNSLPLALGGDLYLGGLNSSPPSYLFAGKLKGNFKGNAVEGLVALDACGLRGVCFGLAGSEINLSIGYGFVLTGARGGLSFANNNNDPCSFADQLPIDPITGRPTGPSPCSLPEPPACTPTITLADLVNPNSAGSRTRHAPERNQTPSNTTVADFTEPAATRAPSGNTTAGPDFPCPALGECPPASVNIYCMPHPESADLQSPHAHRVIYKFTSIDEPLLNTLGITPTLVAGLVPRFGTDARQMAIDLAGTLRAFVDSITPRAPANAPPEIRAADAAIDAALDQVELGFANAVHCAIKDLPANSQNLAALLYDAIRTTAYAGVPCQDLTLKLEGSVSYLGLASFANVAGGVVLSTTGSAGVVGSVNVFGIPVGQARAFANYTDAQGNPILPSMCGEVIAAIGPLELGSLAYLNDCPDCTTALFSTFTALPARLGNAYTFALMQQAFPDLADPSLNATQHLALLNTPERQVAFLGAMFQTPPRDANGQVTGAFLEFVVELADAVQPRWAMCGEVQPRLFGFPLSGGGKLYEYQLYAGPNIIDGRRQGYLLRDTYGFSPVQMMASHTLGAVSGGLGGFLVPAIDEGQISTSFLLPTFGQIARDFFTLPTPEFAAQRTRDFLANAIMTMNYRLAPLGMELGRAGGRVLLPSLDHHPRGPAPRTPPVLRNQGLPAELDVLLAALGDKDQSNAVNRLADISWRGEGDADFAAIFAGSPYARVVAGRNLSLRDDYFPHGGFLGAGLLDFPALLSSPLPPSIGTALDSTQPAGTRLVALQDFIANHLLRTERVGEIAFYIPAPNPPLDRFPTNPQDLIESLRNFIPSDPLQIQSYYPVGEGFFAGWIDTPVLGLPTVRSRATWEPQQALLRLDAEVPTNSWFNRYVNRAKFTVELRGNTNQSDTVLALFTPLSNQVARLTPTSPGLATVVNDLARRLPADLANGLPKVALTIAADQIRIPVPTYSPTTPLSDAMTVARITTATLEAYSPYYQRPGAVGDGALDRVRRDGGFAVLGDFNFLNGAVTARQVEFTVSPNPNPLGLPLVTGAFTGTGLSFFGLPFGGPPATSPSLQTRPVGNPLVEFRADASSVRLDARGSISTLNLGSLFSLAPLTGNALGATARFETTTSALPQGSLVVNPCRLASSLFGGPALRLHGATTNDPFTVSTTGPWNATATVDAGTGFDLRVGADRILRLSRSAAAASQPFRATVAGVGFSAAELVFTNLHLGMVLETYPDAPSSDPRRQTFTLAPNGTASLLVASDGTYEFRAGIPQALPLPATFFAQLQTGFELRLDNTGQFFTGTADGGLWSTLGGGPVSVRVSATAAGLNYRAESTLPVLDFGVFRIDDGSGRGPRVTVTPSGIAFPSGLSLRVNVAAAGNPTLALDRFVMALDGSFSVASLRTSSPRFEGIQLSNAAHTLTRSATGVVSYSFTGDTPARELAGFGSIAPRSGTSLRASVTIDAAGNGGLWIDAALLRLPLIGVTIDALLHGAGNTNAPFGFSTAGPWSAVATFTSLVADPPGTALPEFLRLAPSSNAAAGLFTATVIGNQGNLTGISATRTGTVNLEFFRNSAMARTVNAVNAGTVALAVTNNPRQLTLTLDPPDLDYSTNFVVNDKPITVDLFRLSSASLRVTIASDATGERSIKVENPSLTLLPGTILEQTLAALPTQSLAATAFPIFTGTPVRTLAFRGLPVVRMPSGTNGLLTLTPTGFSSPIPLQEGVTYAGLLTLPSTTSQLSLSCSGSRLRLRFATGPSATVLGRDLSLDGGEATLDVATGGGFTGTFRTTANPPRNLGFNLLGFEPSGTLTLDGIATSSNDDVSLAGNFSMTLAYPNPSNPTQSLTTTRQLAFNLDAGEDFSATVTSGLPSFDLGWLRVQPGNDGNVVVTRSASTGAFGVSFNDWDLRLFGIDYNNQDFALSTSGTLTRNLASSTFNLGSGTGLLRLVTGGTIPFDWIANPAASNAGRTFIDLPSTTSLSLTNVPGLSGTLRDGLAFGTALADIPATGIFDRIWSHNLAMNALDFGSTSVRLRRSTFNGPIEFSASRNNAIWTGLSLSVSANTGNATSFAASLAGTFSVDDWKFGSAAFSYVANDPTAPFQGSATITDPSGTVGLTFDIRLRGGAKPCLEFDFNSFRRTLCQP